MKNIKTICFVAITISIIISSVFYCWNVWERQEYYREQEEQSVGAFSKIEPPIKLFSE